MIDRSLAHDARGILAAATSNVEFVRAHELSAEANAALGEALHELRLVSDVIALLASTGERELELDLRAAFLIHRGGRALAVDATEPPFTARARPDTFRALALAILAIAPRARVRSDGARCVIEPVDDDGARAMLATAVLADGGLEGALSDAGLVLTRKH